MLGWGGLSVISLFGGFLEVFFLSRFLLLLLFIYLFVFNLIENFPLKNRAQRYFVIDKKKHLLDKWLTFYNFT